MNKFDKVLSTAKAHSTGGREGGSSRTDDGRLDVKLSVPGTPGNGTNPEQLFAAGWSSCFFSAMKIVAAHMKVAFPADAAIDAELDLGMTQGSFGIGARLNVSLPGLDQKTADALVAAAHETCPYSKATRGNIDVQLNVAVSKSADKLEAVHQ